MPDPRVGQIWQRHSVQAIHSLSGFYARVESTSLGRGCIAIQRVIKNDAGEWVNAPKSRLTYCNISDFRTGQLSMAEDVHDQKISTHKDLAKEDHP